MPKTSKQQVQHPLIRLARTAVEIVVREGRIVEPPRPANGKADPTSGVFVTIIKENQLRGCVGTIRPTQPSLEAEVIANAVAAALRDPRFSPLHMDELPDLAYVVDLVEDLKRIHEPGQLQPAEEGLAVQHGRRLGVVLPNTAGITSAADQIELALRRAGIAADDTYTMHRFRVQRYIEASGKYQPDIS
jgi:AmmeMemoRadiSam system protein A